jgi:hypothetical protein
MHKIELLWHRLAPIAIIGLILGSSLWIYARINPKDEITIFYNQVGYFPQDSKEFIVEIPQSLLSLNQKRGDPLPLEYRLFDQNRTEIIPSTALLYAGEAWGRYFAIGNCSAVMLPGNYILQVGDPDPDRLIKTVPFIIGTNIYENVLLRAVQFYYYERCGTAVEELIHGYPGHSLCHADDSIEYRGQMLDVSGGWHDAGDYGKYMESPWNTQMAVYALANTYRQNRNYWMNVAPNTYDSPAPDAVDEAIWGARFLQRMTVLDETEQARVFSGVYAKKPNGDWNRFGYWGPPSDETDNLLGTGDERTVGSLWNVSGDEWVKDHKYGYLFVNDDPAMMVAAALVNTALAARDFPYWDAQPYRPTNLVQNATALFQSHRNGYFTEDGEVHPNKYFSELYIPLLALIGLMEWAQVTGNNTAWTYYRPLADGLYQAIMTTIPQETTLHWWDHHLAIFGLYQYARLVNNTLDSDLRIFLSEWANQTLLKAYETERNIFHFMKAPDSYFQYWGTNIPLCLGTMSALIAWNASRSESYSFWNSEPAAWIREYGLANGIHWIMGRNPLNICQIESLGIKNLPLYHNRYCSIPGNPRGAVPGTIPNGIARPPASNELKAQYPGDDVAAIMAGPDVPWFDLKPPNPEKIDLGDFRSNEVYITDNAAFLFGFTTFIAQSGIYG